MHPVPGMNFHMPFPFLERRANCIHPWDRILFETDDFVVVPTVGALVPGWILVVPKVSAICFGAIDTVRRKRLLDVKNYCASVVEERFGEAAVFEHGPATVGGPVGCTVDYAHLHILPAPCDLIDSIAMVSTSTTDWLSVDNIEATERYYRNGVPYLFVEQPVGKAMIADAREMPSQLFRRVVAKSVGRPCEFDWRDFPIEENVQATLTVLAPAFERTLASACAH